MDRVDRCVCVQRCKDQRGLMFISTSWKPRGKGHRMPQDVSKPTNGVQLYHKQDGFSKLVLHLPYNYKLESMAVCGSLNICSACLNLQEHSKQIRVTQQLMMSQSNVSQFKPVPQAQMRCVYTISYGLFFLALSGTEIRITSLTRTRTAV